MASLAKFLEGGAFGVLNDILSTFHSEDGYAVPNRFECLILPPIITTTNNSGAFPQTSYSDPWLTGNDARAVSLRCESTTIPGRNSNPHSPLPHKTYGFEFTAPTRGYQISKDMWWPRMWEKLHCHKDNREAANLVDPAPIGVYKG